MDTPCEWAAKAKNDRGQTFKLTNTDGNKSTEAKLVNVIVQPIGGGYEAYNYSWEGPAGGPSDDGMYLVSGGSAGETELFLIASPVPEDIAYIASITCKQS